MSQNKPLFSAPFVIYLAVNTMFFMGIGIQGIAIPWLLLEQSGGPLSVGIMLCIRALPGIFLVGLAGNWADRYDRRRICFYMNLLQAVPMLIISYLIGQAAVGYAFVYAITLFLSVGNTFFVPAVRAHMQGMIEAPYLMKANSLHETTSQAGNIIGTGLGGILVALVNAANTLAIGAGAFLLSAVLVICMKGQRHADQHASHERPGQRNLSMTAKYIRERRALLTAILFILIPSLVVQVNNILIGAYVKDILHLGADSFSLVSIMYSAGAMLSGVLLVSAKKTGTGRKTIFAALLLLSAAQGWFGNTYHISASASAIFLVGFFVVMSRSWINTKIMEETEDVFGGRIQSVVNMMNSLMILLAGLLIGVSASVLSYQAIYLTIAGIGAAAALLSWHSFKDANQAKAQSQSGFH
ncbi:MFS transporter [Paenibacillus woosongensis]|uniref:MFS transporter n=1 Tax=Paenibacillus woosongensis TaxID=307580 RepID=A0A7X3CL28_9BACL|nr:MFS transporter [Paenibacillus woosongensis]MUG43843.1 MFS transporter [Paenibacillus woosongensis]